MNPGDTKKIVAAVVLLGVAAVLFFVMSSGGSDIPDDETTVTYWWCTETNQGFEIPGTERAEKIKQRRIETDSGETSGPRTRRAGREVESVALSPFTNKFTGIQAECCKNDGTIFPKKNKNGERMICPTCKWDPTTETTATSDRESVLDNWQ